MTERAAQLGFERFCAIVEGHRANSAVRRRYQNGAQRDETVVTAIDVDVAWRKLSATVSICLLTIGPNKMAETSFPRLSGDWGSPREHEGRDVSARSEV
jgi:hypothetical protein